ncbi:MAG: nitroreductase family protein [Bdellovibrionota bacterium]
MADVFTEKLQVPGAAPLAPTDPKEFEKVVRNRRSVRVYDGTPVPESVMQKCIDLALLAPNSSNLQAWEFYWVRSPEKRARLVEASLSQNAATTAAELLVCVGRIDRIFTHSRQMLDVLGAGGQSVPKVVTEYYKKIVPLAYTTGPLSVAAPFKWLLFTLMGFFRPMPREPLGKSDLKLWAAKSCALACENLMLAFSAHGFDTCPMEGLDSKRVKKILGVPRSSVVVMAISVGKRKAEGVYGPQVRFPREQFVHEV